MSLGPLVVLGLDIPLGSRLRIRPELSGWTRNDQEEALLETGPGEPERSLVDSPFSDATVAVTLTYDIASGSDFPFFVGGGLGAHLLVTDRAGFEVEGDSEGRPGLHLLGGVRRRVGDRLQLFGDLRFVAMELASQARAYVGVRLGL